MTGLPLPTAAPFHLEATVRVLQRRPANPVDVWEQGRYRRVLTVGDGLVLAEVENRGTIDAPDVRGVVLGGMPSAAAGPDVERTLRAVLGLDADAHALQRLAAIDARLEPTARALRGMRAPRFAGLFEAFASVIPFQQLSIEAGLAIVTRLVERFGRALEHDGRRYHAFPTAAAVAGADTAALRACGFSAKKVDTLREIARAIESGALSRARIEASPTADAMKALTALPGIGPWSAGLVLLRGFGRTDVFPPGDVGAARSVGALLGLEGQARVDDEVRRFGDVRGYLYFCGIGSRLVAAGAIRPAPERPG